MPISTSSFEDDRDNRYSEYESSDLYEQETLDFSGLTPHKAQELLKRLGAGVEEPQKQLEGVGWRATINETSDGVSVLFDAHDELLDDLIRRFELMVEREVG